MRSGLWIAVAFIVLGIGFAPSKGIAQERQDEAALAEARRMVRLLNIEPIFEMSLTHEINSARGMVSIMNPGREGVVDELLNKYFAPAVKSRLPYIVDEYAKSYARRFTFEELRIMNDFNETPVGQKFIKEMPAIAKDMDKFTLSIGQKAVAEAFKSYLEACRKRGLKVPSNPT